MKIIPGLKFVSYEPKDDMNNVLVTLINWSDERWCWNCKLENRTDGTIISEMEPFSADIIKKMINAKYWIPLEEFMVMEFVPKNSRLNIVDT